MGTRRVKSALELLSDIGSKASDLQGHGPLEIARAMQFMRECGNGPMFDWLVLMLQPEQCSAAAVVHGRTCPKAPHDSGRHGYLHAPDDDHPYDVDGVAYCGRCHAFLATATSAPAT